MSLDVNAVIVRLNRDISEHSIPENLINCQRFFKERLKEPIGLRTPILRKISTEVYKEIRTQPGRDILELCDEMLKSRKRYMLFFACAWAVEVENVYERKDFKRFENWLKLYADGWGSCDSLCCPLSLLLQQYPELTSRMSRWVRSKNRWYRRAAAVSLILPVRKGLMFDAVLVTADALLMDKDDLVQKGYGWMLKEASKVFPEEVFQFVMDRRDRMPRTALRYAIERYPQSKRKLAMAKA